MPVSIDDKKLLEEAIGFSDSLCNEPILKCYHLCGSAQDADAGQTDRISLIYPLDNEVKTRLVALKDKIIPGTKELSYETNDMVDDLWSLLIEKAIICLRIFDKREPFLSSSDNTKHQYVYGIDKLKKYHDNYVDFEGVLYGSDSYYRDHVFHVIRVWLLGIYLLLTGNKFIKGGETELRLIDKIHFEGESAGESRELDKAEKENLINELKALNPEDCLFWKQGEKTFKVHENPNDLGVDFECDRIERRYMLSSVNTFSYEFNIFEKISMWTIIALCHDLGYPLEKSKKVLDKTEKMMGAFMANPYIEKTLRFDGTQDSNNLDIITFASKKMNAKLARETVDDPKKEFYIAEFRASIQDKYKFKYKLSLEDFSHGIISAIIIYKMLIYFIETDNNPDANYVFHNEDARQFYIRRDILRAITAHTCKNVYHIDVPTFPMLLFVCDELQEWGRKSWRNMYSGINSQKTELMLSSFNVDKIEYTEHIDMSSASDKQIIDNIKRIIEGQYILYLTTFRDGQYTARRQFDFIKHMQITINERHRSINNITIDFSIYHAQENNFHLKICRTGENDDTDSPTGDLVKNILAIKNEYNNHKYGICTFVDESDEGGTQK